MKVTCQTRGSLAVVFGEGGVAVDADAEAFAEDEFGVRDVEIGVELGALGVLDAVVGPQSLFAVGRVYCVRKGFEVMSAGEGDVIAGMPVLGEDDVVEAGGEGVDAGDDGVAVGDSERAAGEEVELYVDDEQGVRGVQRVESESHTTIVRIVNAWTRYAQRVRRLRMRGEGRCSRLGLHSLGVLSVWAVLFCPAGAQQVSAQPVSAQQGSGTDALLSNSVNGGQKQAGQPLLGSINGSVTDSDGDSVAGAQVTLAIDSAKEPRTAVTGSDGRFSFAGVAAGKFTVTVVADGMANGSQPGVLDPGESYEIRPMALPVATVATEVDALSVHEQAEEEMKVEEKQRLIGFVPNFYVAYNWNSAPLSTGQKYRLALRNTVDPANLAINAAVAGYQYGINDFIGYGRGFSGYMKRFGANDADLAVGTFVGGAILPAILHQDPRYFYKGTGTVRSRLLYALASTVICKGDNGKWQPNYSSIGGDVAAGALANLYYPSTDRDGVSLTIEQGLLGALSDGLSNVVQEFFFKKVTPHSANYPSTTP